MTGRFAPSPTGPLHVGNLRTALVAWIVARSAGERFIVRMEDLDRSNASADHETRQLADLDMIGIDWDGPVVRQSERFDRYHAAIAALQSAGLVYECYCTRREIAEAAAAPHDQVRAYPGTCRELAKSERMTRRAVRPPALRLRSSGEPVTFDDGVAGRHTGVPDDVVLRRNDGVPAYNLAVVVDDAAQGVDVVVRGDDLLASTPRQIELQRLLGLTEPRYLHVPLVVGSDGQRLAKRHGAVTLEDLAAEGVTVDRVVAALRASIDSAGDGQPIQLADLQRSWS